MFTPLSAVVAQATCLAASESTDGGSVLVGILLVAGVIWAINAMSKPKGWDIKHRGETTIRPRK